MNSASIHSFFVNKRNIRIITVFIVFIYMLFINFECGYISDDFHFHYIWHDFNAHETEKRISCFSDVLISIKNYYLLSGGRALCHFITYILLIPGKWLFNILNSAVFVLLGIVIEDFSRLKTAHQHLWLLPAIYISMLLFLPYFGDDALWLSGSINYLWPTTLLMFCILTIEKTCTCISRKNILRLSVAILFSAATNEISGGMLIIYMASKILSGRIHIRNMLLPLLMTVPGILIVLLAPGNQNRRIVIEEITELTLFQRIANMFVYADHFIITYIIIISLTLILLLLHTNRKKLTFRDICNEYAYFITAVTGYCAIGLSGVSTIRPAFIPVALLFAGTFKIVLKASENTANYRINSRNELTQFLHNTVKVLSLFLIYDILHILICNDIFMIYEIIEIIAMLIILVYVLENHGDALQNSTLFSNAIKIFVKLKSQYMKISICAFIVCIMILISETINYHSNISGYNNWTRESGNSVLAGEEIELFRPPYPDNRLLPAESFKSPTYYISGWLYHYSMK